VFPKIVSSTLPRKSSLVSTRAQLTFSEFANSPNIAIIQHESAVMQVVGHFFENGITSFTTRINSAISFCAANGEVAPFVGHNAFLRWTAIQDASFIDEDDGIRKCWSESHVSEDFDQALRLQMKGWSLRWASYSNGGFQEGVSLTAPNSCSTQCPSGSPRVPSLRSLSDLFGQTVSPSTLKSLSSPTSRPTTLLPVPWPCLYSIGYLSVFSTMSLMLST
jgi:hypothetical protein